jgi:tetratricopeptide (TPR) repeat protein
VSLRWSFRRARRRLRRFRLPLAAAVATLASLLGTVYENIPSSLRAAALLTMGMFGAAAVLLTESPEADYPYPPESPPSSRQARRARRARENPGRSGRLEFGWHRLVWRRSQVVPALPPSDGFFQGRERELGHLQSLHDQQRQARAGTVRSSSWWRGLRGRAAGRRGAAGPVLLLVHGKPGVGKTAIADELARRLARRYPHGQLFVNLGTGGAARTPKEVLKDFLVALGWDEGEMPDTTVGCAMVFRSLTSKKKILFILDAARDADQVRHVLPSDPASAVIITSRQDLMWPDPMAGPSYRLEVPDEDEALSIFRAVSRTFESTRPECAAEIVDLCGRLPLAVRAAAERVSNEGADICQVAGLLREPRSRLTWLDRPGRSLRAHLQTEYDRLLPQEQRALAMLALIPSLTFVPWVLGPLMDLPPAQVEALVDRLATAQLLDDLGMDEASEVARYGLDPLIRLFAAEQCAALSAEEREVARAQLAQAYLEVVSAVLTLLHPEFRDTRAPRWLAPDSKLPRRIADRPETWVRAEYPNLLRVMDLARAEDTGIGISLRWRIGAWLDGCVAAGVRPDVTLDAYDEAVRAAERDRNDLGLVDVLLAKGTFLVAIERYRAAEECLDRAVKLSGRLHERAGPGAAREAARRIATATRKVGEAFLQAASYQHALDALERAFTRAEDVGDEAEQRLIRILLAEAHHVDTPEAAYDELLAPGLTDATRYRIFLSLAEAGRRRGEWQTADDYLDQALRFVDGDLRRVATVQYRMARLFLDQHTDAGRRAVRAPARPGAPGPAEHAARRAAAAAVTFRKMDNAVGVVRAHCLLARAVLAMRRPVEADHLAHVAEGEFAALQESGEKPEVLLPLGARLKRVKGEIRLYSGDRHGGRHLLMEAATAFGEQKDWAGLRGVLRLLEQIGPAGAALAAGELQRALPAEGPLGREDLSAASLFNGPLTLSPAVTESLAVRLSGHVVDRVQDEFRQTFAPATPVAFRGAIGAGLSGEDVVDGQGVPPTWRIPVAELCDLTVVVATGQRAFAGEDPHRPGLTGQRVWREVAVTTGRRSDDVDLMLMIDAPFVDVSDPELSTACPVDGGLVRHRSRLRVTEAGRYDLRVALMSSGRLVQSLPIELVAGDDEETGGHPTDPATERDGVHHGQR